jgi:hypothetical protein
LSSALLTASQQAVAVPLQLWQHQHTTTQSPRSINSSRLQCLSLFSSSSSSSQDNSAKQQQQQEGASPAQDNSNTTSNSGSSGERTNMQQEAKEAAKGMLSKSFDMEELWFAAVNGKLKVWSASAHPDLKVSP